MLTDIVNEQVQTDTVAVIVVNDLVDMNLIQKVDPRCQLKLLHRRPRSKSLLPWIKLNSFLFVFNPDIIHFHLEGLRRMVFHPAPKVFTIHNMHTSGVEYPRYNALYSISDGVNLFTSKQGFKSTTVWNGIDTNAIKKKEHKPYVPGRICSMVCVGRLYTPHKGQDLLIQALSIIKKQGIQDFHLDIIGEGESRGQIESLIAQDNLQDKVALLGQQPREYIYENLHKYDLFVLPSRSEGFGLSVAEAMCARIPVLVCDQEGVMDVINDGALGLSFKTGDAEKLAEGIGNFIRDGEDETITNLAYKYVIEKFNIRQTAQRYKEEYNKVINQ